MATLAELLREAAQGEKFGLRGQGPGTFSFLADDAVSVPGTIGPGTFGKDVLGGAVGGLLKDKSLKGAAKGAISTGASIGGKALGTAVGGPVGGAIGGAAGGFVGDAVGGLFGGKKGGPGLMDTFPIMGQEPQEQFDPGFLSALVESGMLPGYASGALSQPGGPAIVGELGPEMVNLAPQSPVLPFEALMQALSGGGESFDLRGGGAPMMDFGPSDFSGSGGGGFVEEPAAQVGQQGGFMADLARALGSNPFSEGGSLGGLSEALMGSLPRYATGERLAVGGLGAIGNILANRELVKQNEVEKLNQALRDRSKQRNDELRGIAAEERKRVSERSDLRYKTGLERETAGITAQRTADADAQKRRFVLSDKVADKLGLPRGERVDFTQYISAVDKAKDTLPSNEFEFIRTASPKEWGDYVARRGDVARATAEAKPKAVKPSTGEQKGALGYYIQAKGAIDEVAGDLEGRITQVNPALAKFGEAAPNILKGADRQRYEQAVTDFALALNRKQSGGAIAKDEFDRVEGLYFAKVGDTPEKIEQKKRARDRALESLKIQAGPAFGEYYGEQGATDGLSDDDAYAEYQRLVGKK